MITSLLHLTLHTWVPVYVFFQPGMKRGTDTRDECAARKPCKQTRTESWSSPGCFPDEIEVKANSLADSQGLDEAGHILGQVFMQWPISKQVCKIQLATESGALDLVFKGPGVEKLDFLSKDKVKIALKGGRKEVKKAGSPHTLPFKLVFPGGAIVKFLMSEKRTEEKLVDLCKCVSLSICLQLTAHIFSCGRK